jgi:hypothetical protein
MNGLESDRQRRIPALPNFARNAISDGHGWERLIVVGRSRILKPPCGPKFLQPSVTVVRRF